MNAATHVAPKTDRLILRPFLLGGASAARRLAGDRAVADTTERSPYPYENTALVHGARAPLADALCRKVGLWI
jgi:hypothetical protein